MNLNLYKIYPPDGRVEGVSLGGLNIQEQSGRGTLRRSAGPGTRLDDVAMRNQAGELGVKRRTRILIVEDDVPSRFGLCELMWSMGCEAVGVGDWWEALRVMKEEPCDLALLDLCLSTGGVASPTGLDLIPLLRVLNHKMPVVLMTGYGDEQLRTLALRRGATLYLEKPVEPGRLTRLVRQLLAGEIDRQSAGPDR